MPKARANINVYSSARISGLIFEDEKTVPYDDDTRNSTTWCSWSISHNVICIRRTARCVVPNQAETAEDAESTSEHQRIQQYAMFRFNSWRRNDMYTTNCQVFDRCQKHERTSTYTAVRISGLIFEDEKLYRMMMIPGTAWYVERNRTGLLVSC